MDPDLRRNYSGFMMKPFFFALFLFLSIAPAMAQDVTDTRPTCPVMNMLDTINRIEDKQNPEEECRSKAPTIGPETPPNKPEALTNEPPCESATDCVLKRLTLNNSLNP